MQDRQLGPNGVLYREVPRSVHTYIRMYNITDTCIHMHTHTYVRMHVYHTYTHLYYVLNINTNAHDTVTTYVDTYQGVWFGVEELDEVSNVPLCVLIDVIVPNRG